MSKLFFILCLALSLPAWGQDLDDLLGFDDIVAADGADLGQGKTLSQFKKLVESSAESWGAPLEKDIFRVELVDTVPGGKVAMIRPAFEESEKAFVRIMVTQKALDNPAVLSELLNYQMAMRQSIWGTPAAWMETVLNARMGSSSAKLALATGRTEVLGENFSTIWDLELNETATKSLAKRRETLISDYSELDSKARAELKDGQKKFEARKVIFDELDNADGQLKALIAANDRKGVVKLLDNYIPWELLEPVEKQFWQEWLEAVKNPLPIEERVILLRGLDQGQSFMNDAGKPFLMSPILINNQGTYNRRLRSMTTMLDKSISMNPSLNYSQNEALKKKVPRTNRLTNQLWNHSNDPMGSPFISFTKSYGVASAFSGTGKVSVFALDPRIATPNLMSGFSSEIEVLATMFAFPDEVLTVVDSNIGDEEAKKLIKQALTDELGETKADKIFKREFVEHSLLKRETFTGASFQQFYRLLNNTSANNCSVMFAP